MAAGVNVNAKTGVGSTLLHRAAVYGHKEIVRLLIAKGANVNAKRGDGKTPLDTVVLNKKETTDLLRKHGGKTGEELKAEESIHYAIRYGFIEATKQHIAKGADVNAKGIWGRTPLHKAVLEGHKEVAELLIAKGADVNAKNDEGKTPLDMAIDRKRTETAALLRKHGGKTGEELKAK